MLFKVIGLDYEKDFKSVCARSFQTGVLDQLSESGGPKWFPTNWDIDKVGNYVYDESRNYSDYMYVPSSNANDGELEEKEANLILNKIRKRSSKSKEKSLIN